MLIRLGQVDVPSFLKQHDETSVQRNATYGSEAAAAFDIDGVKQQFETYVNLLQQLRQS